jgi:hypothetical protein
MIKLGVEGLWMSLESGLDGGDRVLGMKEEGSSKTSGERKMGQQLS